MKQRFWLTCLILSAALSTLGQDQVNFTQFYLNPYLINPSFAGIDGQSSFSLIYRKQWMNIDGGPTIANMSLHTPVNTRTAVGMNVTSDKRGVLSNTSLLFTLGYNLALEDKTYLRFGLSAGGAWNTIDIEKLDMTDPALLNQLDKNASITGNAGLSFHHKFFHVGVAMPTLFSPSYVSENAFTVTEVKPFQSLIFHATNRFYFNNNQNIFEPYAVYRMNTGLPSQFEFAGIVHLNHVIWAGGSYKQDYGISALAGIKLQHKLAIGASYSLKNTGINELNSPSFEVSLNLLFGEHKRGTHVYSFVNSVMEKKTRRQILAEKRKKEAEEKKKQEEALAKQQEAQRRKDEALAKEAEEQRKKEEEALARAEADRIKAEQDEKDRLANQNPVNEPGTAARTHNPRLNKQLFETFSTDVPPDTTNQDEAVAEGREETAEARELRLAKEAHQADSAATAEAAKAAGGRHEFVKRGTHEAELQAADYVIGGVFKSESNAQHFAEGLRKLGFEANYGHLTEKALWYVYLFATDDINLAIAERDRARKMKLLQDAWLLTVHH